MRLIISHQTNYFYEQLALRSVQYIRMTPMTLPHQTIHNWQVMLPKVAQMQTDGFGNQWLTLSRHEPHNNLQIQAFGEVEINADTLFIPDNQQVPYQIFAVPTKLTQCSEAMRDFAHDALEQFLQTEDIDAQLAILKSLAKDLLDKMPYTKSVTHVGTTAEQAFAMAAGVCQDHTHVFLALLRDKGIAARYVSGYIMKRPKRIWQAMPGQKSGLRVIGTPLISLTNILLPTAMSTSPLGVTMPMRRQCAGCEQGAVTSDCIVKSWYLQAPVHTAA